MKEVFEYWLLVTVKLLFGLAEVLTDLLLGFTYSGGTQEERTKARFYEHSAHLVDVKWKAHYSSFWVHDISNFFYKHNKYVHPRHILEQKNVTLFTTTSKYALFCVTDPSEDIYETKKHPFLFIAHFVHAKQLIILPVDSFHRLAQDLGDPSVPVLVNNMTARCGSTLLCQMFSRIPRMRVLSEPWAAWTIHEEAAKGNISMLEYKALLQSTFRLHCKVEPGARVKWIVFKATLYHAPQFHMLAELFPKFILTFNTRHPVPSFRSYMQPMGVIAEASFVKLGIYWYLTARGRYGFPLEARYDKYHADFNKWQRTMSYMQHGVRLFAMSIKLYMEHKDIYSRVIFYENVAEDPRKELLSIFDLLGVDHEHVDLALEALKHDSQNKTFGERGAKRNSALPEEVEEEMDELFKSHDLPLRKDMTVEEFKAAFGV